MKEEAEEDEDEDDAKEAADEAEPTELSDCSPLEVRETTPRNGRDCDSDISSTAMPVGMSVGISSDEWPENESPASGCRTMGSGRSSGSSMRCADGDGRERLLPRFVPCCDGAVAITPCVTGMWSPPSAVKKDEPSSTSNKLSCMGSLSQGPGELPGEETSEKTPAEVEPEDIPSELSGVVGAASGSGAREGGVSGGERDGMQCTERARKRNGTGSMRVDRARLKSIRGPKRLREETVACRWELHTVLVEQEAVIVRVGKTFHRVT